MPALGHSRRGMTVGFEGTLAITTGNPDNMSCAPLVAIPCPEQKHPQLQTSSAAMAASSTAGAALVYRRVGAVPS